MNKFFAEEHGLKVAIAPVDMDTAAITGNRIKLASGGRCAFLVNLGASTGATVELTLRQHNASSSGTSKDLDVANPYYYKLGAATVFTKVEPTVADALFDLSAVAAADGGLVVIEVEAAQLDINNGFAWVSLDVADSGSMVSKLISATYIITEARQEPAYDVAL